MHLKTPRTRKMKERGVKAANKHRFSSNIRLDSDLRLGMGWVSENDQRKNKTRTGKSAKPLADNARQSFGFRDSDALYPQIIKKA